MCAKTACSSDGQAAIKNKGGEKMAVPLKQMEIERVTNLIGGFGWDLVESRFTNETIVITVRKELTEAEWGLRQAEIDRVVNLVRGFGWELTKSETPKPRLILTIEKKLTPEA